MIRERSEVAREWRRIDESRLHEADWRKWGPHVAERSWGTVREDYSADGDAWGYMPYDHARSKAYRWSEDGIAGFCDRDQRLCIGLALWNGRDSHLKERLFGLPPDEQGCGGGLRERYEALDGTPTHSYVRYAYRYPHAAFPYERLREGCDLNDTGVFEDDRFFDVYVEYAKATPEDILLRITAVNRGSEAADLHVLPTVWFRNTWAWGRSTRPRPLLARAAPETASVRIEESSLGTRWLHADGEPDLLFTENETNLDRLYGVPNGSPFVKDGIDALVVRDETDAVNPAEHGTKAAFRYRLSPGPGEAEVIRLIFCRRETPRRSASWFGAGFDGAIEEREQEADGFFSTVIPPTLSPGARSIARRSFAGLIAAKPYDHFVVREWLEGDPGHPLPPPERWRGPLADWPHLLSAGIACVPDAWAHPSPVASDIALQAVLLSRFDADLAREQILRLLGAGSMHPDGRLPASRIAPGEPSPPLQAWAALLVHDTERAVRGQADRDFLERSFHALLANLGWWTNRRDGGPDATAWTAVLSLDLLAIAVELSRENPAYEDAACALLERFFAHRSPSGEPGLVQLLAVRTIEAEDLLRLPRLARRLFRHGVEPVEEGRRRLSIVEPERLPGILATALDETEADLGAHPDLVLLVDALTRFGDHAGARDLSHRLTSTLAADPTGRRYGGAALAWLQARYGETPAVPEALVRRGVGLVPAEAEEKAAVGA